MSRKNPEVDAYFRNAGKWQKELSRLRDIVLAGGLTEELKWGAPCYTFGKVNVSILGEFKDNCVLSFFKGVLLKDKHGILMSPGENTQSARVVRFTALGQVTQLEPVLKEYIAEAIELERSGRTVSFRKASEFAVPEELQRQLDKNRALKKAFAALTPGRQRAYLLYFAAPKQSKTREARIEKYLSRILAGKGMND